MGAAAFLLLAFGMNKLGFGMRFSRPVDGMRDTYGIFGPRTGAAAGTPFTLVFTFDDTKGAAFKTDPCADYGSGRSRYGANNPGTAVMTINGKSFEFGKRPDARSRIWRRINAW